MGATERSNRLRGETSPYLLQHAGNPVDWYAWREEALARARREDKPILLSIGYSACHWCHVMERESFEDEAIAALMNEHFVCIKVDREERPDLDDIYMAATIAMTGRGGWPMTVFLTPSQQPFYAGTYFPPERRHGLPGFGELLERIAEVWREDRAGVEQQAGSLTEAVRAQLGGSAPAPVSNELIAHAVTQLKQSYDERYGGFGGAPKFPPSPALLLALRHGVQRGDARALALVRGTLDGMLRGGIYDQLGGGFARYSTDEKWHVPHFEKMLYDNAQLARVYVEAWRVTGDSAYERIARETFAYVLRELQAPEGGFYSATDADSEGVEGKFFTFTKAEIEAELDPALARLFCAYYDVRDEGNWEHTNVLWTPRAESEIAAELAISVPRLRDQLTVARERMFRARTERVHPALDDKLLASWNALMMSALAHGASALSEPSYRAAAARAADRLLRQFVRPDGGLYRTARGQKVHLDAYLEDYAFLGNALIDLYESGAERRYLLAARALTERMVLDFAADDGGFYFTARAHEPLIARPQDAQDDALPNATASAAELCARLSYHFGRDDLRARASETVERFGALLPRAPRAFATMLGVVDLLARGPVELAIVGDPEVPATRALADLVGRAYLPHRIVAHGSGADPELPLLAGKETVAGLPTLYICRDFVCEAPLTELEAARRALESLASG